MDILSRGVAMRLRLYALVVWSAALTLMLCASAGAVTLNATKINSAGVWAAGSAVPMWLQMANAAGAFAARVNPYVVVGSAIAQWALSDGQGGQANIAPSSIGGVTPAGWAGPDAPPSTSGGIYSVPSSYGTFPISSISAAGEVAALCDGGSICHWTEFNQKSPSTTCAYTGSGTFNCSTSYLQCGAGMSNPCTPQTFNWTKVINVGCSAGYTLSGNTCTLSTPSAAKWPSDGEPTVYPNGTGFSPHPRDPDTSNNPFGASSPYTRQGYDAEGNPIKESVTPEPGGGFTWERQQEGVGPDGNTAVQKDKVTVNGNGTVTSSTSNTYYNTTINNTSSSSTTAPTDVSALAKEATLQQASGTLTDMKQLMTDEKNDRELDKQPYDATPDAPEISASLSTLWNKFSNKFAPPSLSLGAGTCPVIAGTVPYLDMSVTFDQHCQLEPTLKPVVAGAMLAAWCLVGIIIVLRA